MASACSTAYPLLAVETIGMTLTTSLRHAVSKRKHTALNAGPPACKEGEPRRDTHPDSCPTRLNFSQLVVFEGSPWKNS